MIPKLTCPDCGNNRFAYPVELTDAAIIHCEDCMARVGTFAEVREKIISQIVPASFVVEVKKGSAARRR